MNTHFNKVCNKQQKNEYGNIKPLFGSEFN